MVRAIGMRSRDNITVTEIFLSFQGEGPSSGEQAIFLRLSGCNLTCEWCDSRFTWDWAQFDRNREAHPMSIEDIVRRIGSLSINGCKLLVITGGEPLIQQDLIVVLLDKLKIVQPTIRCEVETNGTIRVTEKLSALVRRFVVSPKLGNAGIRFERRIRTQALESYLRRPMDIFKFVVETCDDLREISDICDAIDIPKERVWVMPQATNSETCLESLREIAGPTLEA